MEQIYEKRRKALVSLVNSFGRGGNAHVAKTAGIDASYLSRCAYPKGKDGKKNIGDEIVVKLDEYFPGWLSLSSDTHSPSSQATSQHDKNKESAVVMSFPKIKTIDKYVTFDVFDVRMSAGTGLASVDRPDVIDHLTVLHTWAQDKIGSANTDKIKLVTCCGVSMQPTIDDGTLMFVDVSVRDFRGDGIYCIAWRDMLLVKRLIADPVSSALRIVSDNPDKDIYRDQVLTGGQIDDLHIIGQVLRWIDIARP